MLFVIYCTTYTDDFITIKHELQTDNNWNKSLHIQNKKTPPGKRELDNCPPPLRAFKIEPIEI